MKTQIAEQQVTPQLAAKIAPDVVNSQGQQKLQEKLIGANKIKSILDQAFQLAAKTVNGTFSSRIKSPDTAIKKLITKRVEGRKDYDIDNINDLAGFRITINKQSDDKKILKEVKNMEAAGLFRIDKSELVRTGTYESKHVDFTTPDGNKGELQIMTHQQKATSLINHSLRSQYGENPPEPIKKVQEAQAKLTDNTSNNKAESISKTMEQLMKQNNDKPLSAHITAAVAMQAQK